MNDKQAGGNQLLNPQEILEKKLKLGYGSYVGALGCGPKAYFAFQAARIVGDRGLVYAADILKDILSSVDSHAKSNGFNNVRTVWSNLEVYGATKIPESSLDLSMLVNVLFQSTNMPEMIKEAIRLIKKGGKLLIIDWKDIGTPIGPKGEKRVDPLKIKEYADVFGMKLEQEFEAGQYHFGLVFIKN